MNKFILFTIVTIFAMFAACGTKQTTNSGNKTASNADKSSALSSSATTLAATTNSPSSVVKDIYEDAMRRNCATIPPKLTETFKKAVGTSKDELEALCDTFTDSGKLASFEIKGEEINGDAATVKVSMTFKDGKKQEKDENLKKSGDKWLMNS